MMNLDDLNIGFIGCGRLASALAWSFTDHGLRVVCVASRRHSKAESLAQRLPGCAAVDAQTVADRCDLVFVTTPDEAIEPAARAIRWRRDAFVAHCSGATEVSALAKAEADGARVGGFHPLQTFGDPEAAARSLPGCTITIEASAPALDALLVALAQRLGCAVNRLPPGARPLYHAAAGYASQFINALLHEAASMWQSWGASQDSAVQALLPMVRGTVASIAQAGLEQGMPGPVSRGDAASVGKHVEALDRFGVDHIPLYRELCERTVVLALAGRRIDADTAQRLRAVLGSARSDER